MSPKKFFSYILVKGFLANFDFRSCWTKFLLIKLNFEGFENSTLLVKILSDNSEIQNLPKIPLPIYKEIFFSGSNSKIFSNKVEISRVWLLGKVPLRGLVTTCPFDRGGLLRCRSDSWSQIIKNNVRSCPFRCWPILAKFGIFGQFGI